MASRREPPERLPPGYNRSAAGNTSGRAPGGPRAVSWEDRPGYLDTPPRNLMPPGDESPPFRYNGEGHRRFGGGGDSPTQLFFEGFHHDSHPRRFPGGGRGRPLPHPMSPDDSPPHGRFAEDHPHQQGRFPEAAPRRFSEDARRRFAEAPARRFGQDPYAEAPIPDERRFGGAAGPRPPSIDYPGHRDHHRHFSDSESPSPPPDTQFFPPPPPPGMGAHDLHQQPTRRYRDDGFSPPHYHGRRDELSPPRRSGVQTRRSNEGSGRSPPRRRLPGAPNELHDSSPPDYADEAPRRFAESPPARPALVGAPASIPATALDARDEAEDLHTRPVSKRTRPRAPAPAPQPVPRPAPAERSEHLPSPGQKLGTPAFSPQSPAPSGLPGVYSRDPTRIESPVGSSEAPRYARPVEFTGGPQLRQGPGGPEPSQAFRTVPGASPATHIGDPSHPHSAGFGEDLVGHADAPPRHVEQPFGPGVAGATLTRIVEGVTPPETTPTDTTPALDDSPRASVLGGGPRGPFVGGPRHQTFQGKSPPGSPRRRGPLDGAQRVGIGGFEDELQSRNFGDELQRGLERAPPRGRAHPDGSPPVDPTGYNSSPSPGFNTPPGYLTPNYYTSSGYATPQQFAATPPYHFAQDSPVHQDAAASPPRGPLRTTPPRQQHESVARADPSRINSQFQGREEARDAGALVRLQPNAPEATVAGRQLPRESGDSSPLAGTLIQRPHWGSAPSASPGPLGPGIHFGSGDSSPAGPPVRYTGEQTTLRSPESPLPDGVFDRGDFGDAPPFASPPREEYRRPPPNLGRGRGAPLLPEEFTRSPPPPLREQPPGMDMGTGMGMGRGFQRTPSPPDNIIFSGLQRRVPDGYVNLGGPRPPPPPWPRPPSGLENDPIFIAEVMPIKLDEKLQQDTPHPGNPGSSAGGGLKDVWAALAFILHIAAIATFSFIFGFQAVYKTIRHYNSPGAFHINDWFPQLSAAALVGAVFSFVWQTAVRIAPVRMIILTIWAGAALMALFGIVLVATGTNLGLLGLLFLFLAVCQALYSFVVSERIPFAGEMLKKVISVCGTYPSTYVVSYLFVLVALAWLGIWIFGLSGAGDQHQHVWIMVAFVVSLGWTLQVLRNIVRVTVAGTVSLFYFQEGNMPPRPTYISLIRSCTFSIGSICFGSFVVPLVELPCHALRRINSQAGTSEFLFSCIVCMLACFDHLIRYFNRLGYIQVAIHGKPFIRASKDTWDMLRAQDVDVLIHDDLASTILFLACGAGGSLSAIVGGVYTFVAHKSLTVAIALISFAIGGLMTYVTMAVLESAISTYYVCFAEDPRSLQQNDGPLYERMWVRQMDLKSPVTELTA